MLGAAVGFLIIMPAVGTWYSSRRRRRASARRAIERRAVTAIATLREGEPARIRGVVAAREPLLTSPISGRACIGYQVIIDDRSHHPDFEWIPLVDREVWPSFLVTDETGTMAVQGQLQMLVDPSDGGPNLPAEAYALLQADDVRMKDLWGPRQFWFRETLLKLGDRVSVVGRPSLEVDRRLPVMRGSDDQPVVIIDDDEGKVG